MRIPLLEEQLQIDKRLVETGQVRIRTSTVEQQEKIDLALLREDVQISRVPVNRPVDHPVATRQEGDVTIISLHKEVAVTATQLVLVEELHVSMRRSEVVAPQYVNVRREQIQIERTSTDCPANGASGEAAGSAG